MYDRRVSAESLREFMMQVFLSLGYSAGQAVDAADVLMWASLRSIDTHGVRNLKNYYVDRTLSGLLRPNAQIRVEHETPQSARLDGDSGLGLACACHAMRLAIAKATDAGVGVVAVRNAHHLGPAGYFAHMAVEHGMVGMCMTGHFFGRGHHIGVAPLQSAVPMFSTNPFSFAAPCGKHPPFVLDMASSIATVNRIEMHGQAGMPIPPGWARDSSGNATTDPTAARVLSPLGGTAEHGAYKGLGLAMMVSVLSGVLSKSWRPVAATIEAAVQSTNSTNAAASGDAEYNQPTMGHFFLALLIELFQPLDDFRQAMDAMIDALHATPVLNAGDQVSYPGEPEAQIAAERLRSGVPLDPRLYDELSEMANSFGLEPPK